MRACRESEHALSAEPFALRVRALHDAWRERREVNALTSAHDRDSQFRLLLTLHGWALEAIADVRSVYGVDFPLTVDAAPIIEDASPGFVVRLDRSQLLAFSLLERNRAQTAYWYLSVSRSATSGEEASAGTDRRNGHWSRSRLEELLLTLLGGYERAIGAGARTDEPAGQRLAAKSRRAQ